MRGTIVLITVAAMLTTMALSAGSVFADPPADPPTDSGNPSCFGALARAPATGGPGQGVSELASSGASQVADVLVPVIQQNRPCPPTPPTEIKELFP